jgi:hypothetical protein
MGCIYLMDLESNMTSHVDFFEELSDPLSISEFLNMFCANAIAYKMALFHQMCFFQSHDLGGVNCKIILLSGRPN